MAWKENTSFDDGVGKVMPTRRIRPRWHFTVSATRDAQKKKKKKKKKKEKKKKKKRPILGINPLQEVA